MALTPAIKTALNGMNNVDKALVMLYIFGVDDPALAASVGQSFVQAYHPNAGTVTANNMALAILLHTRAYVKSVHVGQQAFSAAEQARVAAAAAAEAAIPYNDIGNLP